MSTKKLNDTVELGPMHPDLFDGETPIILVSDEGQHQQLNRDIARGQHHENVQR